MTLVHDGWPGRILLAWLQIRRPDARQLTSVEPFDAYLDEVDEVQFRYVDKDGTTGEFTAAASDLEDLRRFYEDADYPMQA